jgi:hypothetical protein
MSRKVVVLRWICPTCGNMITESEKKKAMDSDDQGCQKCRSTHVSQFYLERFEVE